jgi:hypothetical protein
LPGASCPLGPPGGAVRLVSSPSMGSLRVVVQLARLRQSSRPRWRRTRARLPRLVRVVGWSGPNLTRSSPSSWSGHIPGTSRSDLLRKECSADPTAASCSPAEGRISKRHRPPQSASSGSRSQGRIPGRWAKMRIHGCGRASRGALARASSPAGISTHRPPGIVWFQAVDRNWLRHAPVHISASSLAVWG